MKFVWVNGRRPSSRTVCAFCSRPIEAGYLRHVETRLCYCDHDCFACSRPDNSRVGPLTPQEASAILESALMVLLHDGESELAY